MPEALIEAAIPSSVRHIRRVTRWTLAEIAPGVSDPELIDRSWADEQALADVLFEAWQNAIQDGPTHRGRRPVVHLRVRTVMTHLSSLSWRLTAYQFTWCVRHLMR